MNYIWESGLSLNLEPLVTSQAELPWFDIVKSALRVPAVKFALCHLLRVRLVVSHTPAESLIHQAVPLILILGDSNSYLFLESW